MRFKLAALCMMAAVTTAHADDTHWCLAWAREAAWVYLMHMDDVELATAAPNLPAFTYSQLYFKCLNADEALLLPETEWIKQIKDAMAARVTVATAGTVPATEAPTPTASTYDPAKIKACERRFRSFNPNDNTVIQRHHRKRELCPLL